MVRRIGVSKTKHQLTLKYIMHQVGVQPPWHAEMISIQITKYHATFKILFNLVKYMVKFFKYGATFRNISCISGRMYIFGNMYNGLSKLLF